MMYFQFGAPELTKSVRKLMGLAVLHWSGMLFSNISVSEVHISFTHTVKAEACGILCRVGFYVFILRMKLLLHV